MNNVTMKSSIDTFHITAICPEANKPATLHIYILLHCYLSLHIDPTLLHISINTLQNATLIYNATAIYVPATNMPIKCHIYSDGNDANNSDDATAQVYKLSWLLGQINQELSLYS